MNTTMTTTALIAEDEPLLAQALQTALARAWPELRIVASVGDGLSAVTQALALAPQVLFFDIRMPGQSGLDAAAALADGWPTGLGAPSFPALVFVTAYDQYAVQAFEAQALDYVLKPIQAVRLEKTVEKLRRALAVATPNAMEMEAHMARTMAQLRQVLAATAPMPTRALRHVQVSVGAQIRLISVQEVVCFEAADKYVRVLTANHEYLIRTPLKELLAQLDPQTFWQVHRGALVRVDAIESVQRDGHGKLQLRLRGRSETLAVSRLYADLFRAM
ncbi:MAG: DNA-binding response regulator [Rhodoferax sp.]|nr:DNA-binding response regulator [Rhodoferax sp.]